MSVQLRPHHLLCILTFIGRGYTPAFTENMKAIAARLAAGEEVEIISGPDDICAPMLSEATQHCHSASVTARDQRAAIDLGGLLGWVPLPGDRLVLHPELVENLREAFRAGSIRSGCADCTWDYLCRQIAAQDFAGAILPVACRI